MFEHYGPLDSSRFTPMSLMEPRRETIPVDERFERLRIINNELARRGCEFKRKVFMEAGEQWEKEGKLDRVFNQREINRQLNMPRLKPEFGAIKWDVKA